MPVGGGQFRHGPGRVIVAPRVKSPRQRKERAGRRGPVAHFLPRRGARRDPAYMYDSRWRAGAWAAVMAMAAVPSAAAARDRWTSPHPGIRHLHRVRPGLDLHVVLVDLASPEVSVVATRPEDRFTTTSQFARRYGAVVAVNANFWGRGSCGLAAGGGEVYPRIYEDGCIATLGVGPANDAVALDTSASPHGPLPAMITEAWSGKPWLMRDGQAPRNWVRPQHLYRPNPRTAAALTADRGTMILLSADGRRPGVPGLTGFQLVDVLREFGAHDAINLDGGGSTTLVMNSRVVNRPSDRHERAVITHLGIRLRPGAAWYAGQITGQGSPASVTAGQPATLWVEARNTGRRAWSGALGPTVELTDGGRTWTSRATGEVPPGGVGRFEVAWEPRAFGHASLRARLVAPEGALLVEEPIRFDVAVRAPSAPTSPAVPPRVETPQVMTASMGFGCHAQPGAPSGLAWGVLGVFGSLVAALRRRRRPDA